MPKKRPYRVQHREQSLPQILVIRRVFQLLVLGDLDLLLVDLAAALDQLVLLLPQALALHDNVVEVELFEDRGDDVHLDEVAGEEGLVGGGFGLADREGLARDQVADVHDVLVVACVVVIKKDLERLIIRLIHDQRLPINSVFLVRAPGLVVVLDHERARLKLDCDGLPL